MKLVNKLLLLSILLGVTAACAPAATATPLPTYTPYPTYTPFPTYTPPPTSTPRPTLVPTPRATSTPRPTATPSFVAQTQTIGPIYDSLYESKYTMEVTVEDIEWLRSDGYSEPKAGNVFAIVTLKVVNQGPGSVRSFGSGSFQALDANGVLHDYTFTDSSTSCGLEYVDILPNGTLRGCVVFEVPANGKVDLIYAPYQYEGLKPGRYLSFPLRP